MKHYLPETQEENFEIHNIVLSSQIKYFFNELFNWTYDDGHFQYETYNTEFIWFLCKAEEL